MPGGPSRGQATRLGLTFFPLSDLSKVCADHRKGPGEQQLATLWDGRLAGHHRQPCKVISVTQGFSKSK